MIKYLRTTMRMWLWLMILLLAPGGALWAQVTLSGTSYSESFDNLSAGLPNGWTVRTNASVTSLGTATTLATAQTAWATTAGNFRNTASADGLTATTSTTDQNTAADRALSVRQTGSFGDPGAAFTMQLNNTTGFQNFSLSFKLQSLDVSPPRTTTWRVDYGFGTAPTSFSSATTAGTLTTGASQFSNNTITANFGSALDNQSGPVWIRIVAVTASSGSGNRPTTGIDDFSLTYSPAGPVLPTLSINDASVQEGNAGTTTATFTVSLSSPAPAGGVTFDIATADNTATVSGNDYVAKSLTGQTIPEGSISYTFDVAVNGDTDFEPSETFFVNVTNITGATSADGQGTGTIQNDDASAQPTLTANGTLNPFTTTTGTPSATQTYRLTGSALSADVTVTTPSGFEVNVNGGLFAATQTIAQSGGNVNAMIGVRLTGAVQGSFSGNMTNQSAGLTTQNIAVSGTVNAPVAATRIRDIQGIRHISPFVDQSVNNVEGIVTAVRTRDGSRGFYMQDDAPDNDDRTSEGIFVFTGSGSTPTVSVGDRVRVSGTVSEFRPGGNTSENLTVTQIGGNPTITTLSSGNTLPAATVLGTGGRAIPTTVIDNDAVGGSVENNSTPFDPAEDGIDFYESLEGMLVQINSPVTTSPTASFTSSPATGSVENREMWVLADNGANAGDRTARGGILIRPTDFNPERIQLDDILLSNRLPYINVATQFSTATGIISNSFERFEVLVTSLPTVTAPSPLTKETTGLVGTANQLTVGTFNVENLGGNEDQNKFNVLSDRIVNSLKSPDILVLEEIQDNNGATNDAVVDATTTFNRLISAITAAGGPAYEFRQINPQDDQDGGQGGGNIRIGFLFNPARVQFANRPAGNATTTTTVNNVNGQPQLSLNPGRVDPNNAAFAGTDINGNAYSPSRKPLVGEFVFNGQTVFVIGNHFSSKGPDQPLFGRFQPPALLSEPQRNAQATVVRNFVESILAVNANANVIVAGDINDFEFSQPVTILEGAGLTTLIEKLPANERYTYNFEGNAQSLDHIMVSSNLNSRYDNFDVVHINSEFADQESDHDPSVARFNLAPATTPLALTLTANPTQILTTGTTTLSATVSGGTTPYSYVFAGPATSTILPNGNTATVSGLSAGVQTFTVIVTDVSTPTSQTISGTVSITVNQANQAPTVATNIASQTATVDQAFNFVIPANTFTDDAGVVSIAVTGLPAGLSFDGSTTAISGTPTTAGVSSVTVTATDAGNLSVSTTFSITVNPAPAAPLALMFTASPTQILATETTTLQAFLSGGTAPYSYTFSGPGTITQSGNTATVSSLTAGVQTFTVVAIDATTPVSQTISGTVSVTVNEPTSTPQADLSVNLTDSPDPVVVNTSLTYSFTVTNAGPSDASNVSIQLPLPAGTSFNSLSFSNGFTATTPAVGQGGTINITTSNFSAGGNANFTLVVTPTVVTPTLIATIDVTAGDATTDPNSANNVASVTTTVIAANTAPTTTGIADQTATVGQSFSLNVASAFTDAETPNSFTLSANGLPAELTLTNGVVSGTPSTTSVNQVTVTATDPGSLSVSATFTLTISAPISATSTAPFAITGVTTVSCETVRADLRRVTFAPNYAGLTSQPVSFSVVNEMPATTQMGPYTLNLYIDNPTITLQAVQGGSQSSFIYNWLAACGTTAPVNQAPTVATPIANQTATASQPFNSVIPTGTFADDADASLLVLSVAGLPASLSFTTGNKTISGTPTTAGTSSVTVTATDAGNLSVSTSFVLTVNDPGTTAPFAITGVTTVNCVTLTADQRQVSFTPQYVGLTGQPVSFSVVNELPTTTNAGPYTLKLYIDNPTITLQAVQAGTQSSFVYNWLAACGSSTPTNQAPTVANPIANQTATINQPFSLVIPAGTFADDADATLLTLAVAGLPANLSFDAATKTISGIPTGSSTSLITVTATDAGNLSVSTNFVLTVNDPSSTAPFAITGVTTVSCETVRADLRRVTFAPQYAGLTGQPVSFSVVNELPATTNVGPYTLNLYTDNPTVTLQAVQGGTSASFTYNWLAACGSTANARRAVEQQAPLMVTVLGNPTAGETVTVEVKGAAGQPLQLRVSDLQGQTIDEQQIKQAASAEQHQLRLGRATGMYLLQVSTPTKTKVIKIVRQ